LNYSRVTVTKAVTVNLPTWKPNCPVAQRVGLTGKHRNYRRGFPAVWKATKPERYVKELEAIQFAMSLNILPGCCIFVA